MFNFYYVYLMIICIALMQWAQMRFSLFRGLQIVFVKCRQQNSMSTFFSIYAKPYLTLMIWVLVHSIFITYCCFKLAQEFRLLNAENSVIIIMIMIFFLKDRIYYTTANFVLSKLERPV